MYKASKTVVTCAVTVNHRFKVGVKKNQGSALSPFWFVMVDVQVNGWGQAGGSMDHGVCR